MPYKTIEFEVITNRVVYVQGKYKQDLQRHSVKVLLRLIALGLFTVIFIFLL